MSAFQLLELAVIQKGGLVARCRLQMPSGLQLTCNVLRSRKDASVIFVMPPAEKLQSGGYAQIVDFATPELKTAWQAAALEALRPRMTELTAPTTNHQAENAGGNYAPF